MIQNLLELGGGFRVALRRSKGLSTDISRVQAAKIKNDRRLSP